MLAQLTAQGLRVIVPNVDLTMTYSELIEHYADRVDSVIVGGGDGSLNAAASGLVATGLPLGVLPLGTANDFARTLGIPFDLKNAISVIVAGHRRAVDLGKVNGHLFFNVSSIGFSAALARELTAESKNAGERLAMRWLPVSCCAKVGHFVRKLFMKAWPNVSER